MSKNLNISSDYTSDAETVDMEDDYNFQEYDYIKFTFEGETYWEK